MQNWQERNENSSNNKCNDLLFVVGDGRSTGVMEGCKTTLQECLNEVVLHHGQQRTAETYMYIYTKCLDIYQ